MTADRRPRADQKPLPTAVGFSGGGPCLNRNWFLCKTTGHLQIYRLIRKKTSIPPGGLMDITFMGSGAGIISGGALPENLDI
jgi:hypothetical protein